MFVFVPSALALLAVPRVGVLACQPPVPLTMRPMETSGACRPNDTLSTIAPPLSRKTSSPSASSEKSVCSPAALVSLSHHSVS